MQQYLNSEMEILMLSSVKLNLRYTQLGIKDTNIKNWEIISYYYTG